MINISFTILNPFTEVWKELFCKSINVSKNKAFEIGVYKSNTFVHFYFGLDFKRDHAGPTFSVGLLGYDIELLLYDTRHWDYENECWEVKDK